MTSISALHVGLDNKNSTQIEEDIASENKDNNNNIKEDEDEDEDEDVLKIRI